MCKVTEKDSARAQARHTIQMAMKAFENHHLIRGDKTSDRWVLARKYEDGSLRCDMLTEIISLWGGRIFVGGDIDDCSFAYYSDTKQDHPEHHLRKLAWMGRCQDITYYVAQKAEIGMTDSGKLVWTWDDDVARYDLYQMAMDKECWDDETRNEFIDIMGWVSDGEWQVWNRLYEAVSDPCDLSGKLGKRLSSRVIYAWAAIRRLCEFLLGPHEVDPRGDLA